MPNVEMKMKERYQDKGTVDAPKGTPSHEGDRLAHLDHKAEKNLMAKKVMASELASMGLSQEAIDRLLHLKARIEREND